MLDLEYYLSNAFVPATRLAARPSSIKSFKNNLRNTKAANFDCHSPNRSWPRDEADFAEAADCAVSIRR